MAITYSELSNKTAPNNTTYETAFVSYDTNVYDSDIGQNALQIYGMPYALSSTYTLLRPQIYYTVKSRVLTGTIYFRAKAKDLAFNGLESGKTYYELSMNCYDSNKQFISSHTIVARKKIYQPLYSGQSSQWTSGKYYYWRLSSSDLAYLREQGITTSSSWSTVTSTLINAGIYAYGHTGDTTYYALEPFAYRYASDDENVHYNGYNKSLYTVQPMSFDNCLSNRNAPANGGCQDFSLTLPSGAKYVNFTLTMSTSTNAVSVTFPDYSSTGPMPVVDTTSKFYRYNGSQWKRVALSKRWNGSKWVNGELYYYNGSRWVHVDS